MNFGALVITVVGQSLLSKSLAAGSAFSFTSVKTTDSVYTQEQLADLYDLAAIKQVCPIEHVTSVTDTSVRIRALLDNHGLLKGYHIRTVGVFAQDPEQGEILFAVAVDSGGSYMPADSETSSTGLNLDFILTVSNASVVKLDVSPTGAATLADLYPLIEDVERVSQELVSTGERLTNHTHGNISKDGCIGVITALPVITGDKGKLQTGSFGSIAGTFCVGNDPRLSDNRKASDVYTWAKAATKPAYTAAEVGASPTGHKHDADYLGITAKAADSNKLNGKAASEYADKSHKHAKADISDFPASMPASDVYAWAKTSTKPAYTANEVGAAAAAHNHDASNINSGTLSLARGGTGVSSQAAIGLMAYPVGAVYMSINTTSPATLFGGTWTSIETGRFLVAAGSGYGVGGTGGATAHTHGLGAAYGHFLTSGSSLHYRYKSQSFGPNWTVPLPGEGSATGISVGSAMSLGGSTDNGNNMPPWFAVYMWRRTA